MPTSKLNGGNFPHIRKALMLGDESVWRVAKRVVEPRVFRWLECYFLEGMSQREIMLFNGVGKTYVGKRITNGLAKINEEIAKNDNPS